MHPVELIQQASSKLLKLFKEQFNRTSEFVYLHELLYCQHRLKAMEEQLQDEELVNEIVDGFMTENFLQFGTNEKWEVEWGIVEPEAAKEEGKPEWEEELEKLIRKLKEEER